MNKKLRSFTCLADLGAAEDDHPDPVYVCHQVRGLSIIRVGITHRLPADAPITSLCTLPPVLLRSGSSRRDTDPLARAMKGRCPFLEHTRRLQLRHTYGVITATIDQSAIPPFTAQLRIISH